MEYGLIGEKLGHSYSKLIQEKLIENYTYDLKEVSKEDLDLFMKKKDFKAINVTIPYKQMVMPYLKSIDEASKKIGAVNTIVNKNGELYGHNTDYLGFAYMIKHHKISLEGKNILIMGNGGASQAIQAVVDDSRPAKVLIVDIKPAPKVVSIEEVYADHRDINVIINTTPIGMYPNVDKSPIILDKFHDLEACIDVVYNPFNTEFALQAKERGIKAVTGLEMLVAQAKYALEFFKDIKIDDAKIEEIYHEIIQETTNLILVGMPSSGKTSIGKAVAKKLGKNWYDIDAEIVKQINMSIAEYFQKYGEKKFRELESDVTTKLCICNNCVISSGGGTVLNHENVHNLRRNGVLVLIDRNLDKLISDNTRPLSSSKEAVQKLYEERMPIYEKSSDIKIENNGAFEQAVNDTIDAYHFGLMKNMGE